MKKIIFSIIIIFMSIIPTQAKQPQQILIISSSLPDLYILQDDGNHRFHIRILDRDTHIPFTCLPQEKAKFNELTLNTTSIDCQIKSINKTFNLNIKNYIRLDLKNIAKDFHIHLSDYNLHDFQSTLSIFKIIGTHLNMQTILHYQDYIKTDLSLSSLFTLYKHYQDGPLKIFYLYPRLIYLPYTNTYYPLEKIFYPSI